MSGLPAALTIHGAGHARKMVAKLLDMQKAQTLYYENIEGGHGGAADNKQRAFMSRRLRSVQTRMKQPEKGGREDPHVVLNRKKAEN